jgi:hypothetical protein
MSNKIEARTEMCPDCRQPNKLTRSDRYRHKHCDECTAQCKAMMETDAAHVVLTRKEAAHAANSLSRLIFGQVIG